MIRVHEVAELDFVLEPYDWPFSRQRAADIAAHWRARLQATPAMWDGRVLMMRGREFAARPDGRLKLTGAFFPTQFSHYLAWRDFGFAAADVRNAFAMAALKTADGAFLLCEMGAHTSNPGRIYFPSGTPDEKDVFGDRVDLAASAARELAEETGLTGAEARPDEDWFVVETPHQLACMKVMRVAATAAALQVRIHAFLAAEAEPELAAMHIARRAADIDPARAPDFIPAFLDYAFARGI